MVTALKTMVLWDSACFLMKIKTSILKPNYSPPVSFLLSYCTFSLLHVSWHPSSAVMLLLMKTVRIKWDTAVSAAKSSVTCPPQFNKISHNPAPADTVHASALLLYPNRWPALCSTDNMVLCRMQQSLPPSSFKRVVRVQALFYLHIKDWNHINVLNGSALYDCNIFSNISNSI